MEKIVYLPIDTIKPYKKNPRRNRDAIDAVAASIKEYGFRSPIQILPDRTIINGHTRYEAARKLGLADVPCVIVADLTEDQVKAYRLIDNKSSEYAKWDQDLLAGELEDLDLGTLSFDFDFQDDLRKKKSWSETTKRCDLKPMMRSYRVMDNQCFCFFKTGKKGTPLEEVKTEANVDLFVANLVSYVEETFGRNISKGGWCLMTTPRRRHTEGFHFATAVCRGAGRRLYIPFYEDAVIAENRKRVDPHFYLQREPNEKNVILYDDIVTTGSTMRATRELLDDLGCNVFEIAAISNR